MFGASAHLGSWVVAWAVLAGLVLLSQRRRGVVGTGLVGAYVLNLGLNHWLGGAIYLLPGYLGSDPDTVLLGFQQSTYAVGAFALGVLFLAPTLARWVQARPPNVTRIRLESPPVRLCLVVGLAAFAGVAVLPGRVPTLQAIGAQGWGLLIVGLGLGCWNAWRMRSRAFLVWLGGTLLLPFATIVTQGFLGFGAVAAMAILTFVASFSRPGWKGLLAALVLSYLALSVFVTYMRDRSQIREVVWGGGPLAERVDQLSQTAGSLEWFDLSNPEHLSRIDSRLNQNVLVGEAVTYLDQGLAVYAQGETVWNGVLALVPRAIWPGKPVAAGSAGLVGRFTGIEFASGTSVGIGNVMESYVSFGSAGVVVAFALLGAVIGMVDSVAGRRLRESDWRGFLLWYLPGLSLLQVGGSFVEVTSSVGAALMAALLVTSLLRPLAAADATRRTLRTKPAWSRA